jgi:hypothetical protein
MSESKITTTRNILLTSAFFALLAFLMWWLVGALPQGGGNGFVGTTSTRDHKKINPPAGTATFGIQSDPAAINYKQTLEAEGQTSFADAFLVDLDSLPRSSNITGYQFCSGLLEEGVSKNDPDNLCIVVIPTGKNLKADEASKSIKIFNSNYLCPPKCDINTMVFPISSSRKTASRKKIRNMEWENYLNNYEKNLESTDAVVYDEFRKFTLLSSTTSSLFKAGIKYLYLLQAQDEFGNRIMKLFTYKANTTTAGTFAVDSSYYYYIQPIYLCPAKCD